MTIALRQEAPGPLTAAAVTTVTTPAFGSNCLIGSAIAVWLQWGGSTLPTSVVDSASQAYTFSGVSAFDTNDGVTLALYYKLNNASATALTVTATWATGQPFQGIWAAEISGATASPYQTGAGQDQVAPGTGTGVISSGNVTPTSQPCLLYAVSNDDGGNASSVVAGGLTQGTTGFQLSGSTAPGGTSAYQRLTSTSAIAATFTNTTDGGTRRFLTLASVWTEASSGSTATIAWVV